MKKDLKITSEKLNHKMIHSPNPLHVSNFLQGSKVTKNKKKYTRKEKHRGKDYD